MSSEKASSSEGHNEVLIRAQGLTKTYRIWDRPSSRLLAPTQEFLSRMFPAHSKPAAYLRRRASSHYRDFHALQNVSFTLSKGESLGVIGRNGSGKSTLLQILAGTLRPTEGECIVRGRVAALLELGSGFNPEFTGRENVMLNGAILGFSREEMEKRFSAVAEFADIGEFIDRPVKTYSSGMMIRLAFSVQTMVDPDILIIDEALSVGDVFFQQKCFRRLDDLRQRGVATILVSHGMNIIEQYCDRAILLNHGRVHAMGSAPEVVKQFYLVHRDADRTATATKTTSQKKKSADENGDGWPPAEAFFDISGIKQITDGTARCLSVGVTDETGTPRHYFEQGETAHFYFEYELLRDIETPVVGMLLFNDKGIIVHGKNSLEYGVSLPHAIKSGTTLRFRQTIKLDIQVGEYTIEVGIASILNSNLRFAADMTHQQLTDCVIRHCHLTAIGPIEIGFRKHGKPVQLLHHGVANLEGTIKLLSRI
ncbi:MAG: ABC transporter ATP-binding protein [Verrucomicrobia bacterium]|nr:MAG: ABC transporter ATP-binding protein [Verrucomicrobiota bacterium]